MIKELSIQNTGRIQMLKAQGETNFKPRTFIFGRNTFGKSTITAVMRSLQTGNIDYIIGRKRIGGQNQMAKVVTVNPNSEHYFTTTDARWNQALPSLVVFDSDFVRESVYTQNQQIDSTQQKNIEAFMLGTKAKSTIDSITKIDEEMGVNTKFQSATTTEYNRSKHALGGLQFDDFLKLKEVKKVVEEIEKKEAELQKIKNSELIKTKLEALKNLLGRYIGYDLASLNETLTVDSSAITAHYEEHINNEDCTKRDYGTFLRAGAELRTRAQDEKCPFCTQSMDEPSVHSFLEAIDSIYNEKYQALQESVRNAEKAFEVDNYDAQINSITTDLEKVGYTITTDYSSCRSVIEAIKKAVIAKKDNLAQNFDKSVATNLKTILEPVVQKLEEEITTFSNPSEQKAVLETELNLLKAANERYGAWKERCEQYEAAKASNATLSEQRKQKWVEYEKHAQELSDKCLDEINTFLGNVGCNFKVKKFAFQGNKRGELLILSIDGEEIQNTGDDTVMNIKNTLSDSDKWILALAFFVVGAKNEEGVNVVVMDDPVSSFDTDRKRLVLNQIMGAFKDSGKQLILLTHERGFFKLAHHEYSDGNETTFLKLDYCATTGTDIVLVDPSVDSEFIDKYLEWVSDMKKAVNSNDLNLVKNAHGNIRKVVEHVLKAKYPNWISKEDITVDKMLTALEIEGGPYEKDSRRTDLSGVLHNLEHHDNSGVGQYPDEELGIEDYRNDIKQGFLVIEKL